MRLLPRAFKRLGRLGILGPEHELEARLGIRLSDRPRPRASHV